MSNALNGFISGAIFTCYLSEKYARKRSLILSAFLFTFSAYQIQVARN